MATRKKTPKQTDKAGWKTCSRGHHYRGPKCPRCWPARDEEPTQAKR